jgi:light-regulated signal transduction histidine kinase (bacteriophytochrome)
VPKILSDLEIQIQRTKGTVWLEDLTVVEADRLQMCQLLQNLVGCALKYRKPDLPPVVIVSARQISPVEIQILVEDNGIGFDECEVERIFQPLQRLVSRSEYEGSGMGLAICRKIVERQGGAITARSEPGIGSTFIVTLPYKAGKC